MRPVRQKLIKKKKSQEFRKHSSIFPKTLKCGPNVPKYQNKLLQIHDFASSTPTHLESISIQMKGHISILYVISIYQDANILAPTQFIGPCMDSVTSL